MYLVTCTRPDVAVSVSYLSPFSSQPLARHHTAVRRIFRYLAGTRSMSLNYKRCPTSVPWSIVAFSDSDYASCCDTRRYISGYAFMLNRCALFQLFKKQQSVALSTTEAEYMALATTSGQGVWNLNACTQLSYTIPIIIMAHNTSRMNVAENPIHNFQTKHIDIAYHFTREHLSCKHVTHSYVPSNDNTADLMPKGLNYVACHGHTQRLGSSEWESVLWHTCYALCWVNTIVRILLISLFLLYPMTWFLFSCRHLSIVFYLFLVWW